LHKLVKQINWYLFCCSLALMGWWALLWPFVIADGQHEKILHVGALMTLMVFFASLIVLLVIRIKVVKRMGGVKGCTHINDLVAGPLAVTAYQTVIPAKNRRREKPSDGKRPAIIDTCHAYARDGDVVKRLWPDFFEKTES